MDNEPIEKEPGEMLSEGLHSLLDGVPSGADQQQEPAPTVEEGQDPAATPSTRGTKDATGADIKPDPSQNGKGTTNSASTTTPGKDGKPQPQSRFDARIKELNDGKKAEKDRADRLERELAEIRQAQTVKKDGEVKQEPRAIVPKPEAPKYTMEQLKALRVQAKQAGDEALLEAVEEQIEAVRDYSVKLAAWEIKNGEAVRQNEAAVIHFRQQAVNKWPDLTKADSPISRVYAGAKKMFPEIANRSQGDGDYHLANLAHILVRDKERDAVEGALKKEIEELKAKVTKYEGKLQPAKSRGADDKGTESDADEDPGAVLTRRLHELLPA